MAKRKSSIKKCLNANYNKTPLLSKPEGFRCQWCFHYVWPGRNCCPL